MYKQIKRVCISIFFISVLLFSNIFSERLAVLFEDQTIGIYNENMDCPIKQFKSSIECFEPGDDYLSFYSNHERFLLRSSRDLLGFWSFEIWDSLKNVCIKKETKNLTRKVIFSPDQNFIAYVVESCGKDSNVHIYDIASREIVRTISYGCCLGIHFSKARPDYLIVAGREEPEDRDVVLKYHHIKNEEKDDKEESGKIVLNYGFYRCVFNDYDEDKIACISPIETRVFSLGSSPHIKLEEKDVRVEFIDETTVALSVEDTIALSAEDTIIVDLSTWEQRDYFTGSASRAFLNSFFVYFKNGEIKVHDVVEKTKTELPIPCEFDSDIMFKIKRRSDSFVLAVTDCQRREVGEILFYDSRNKSWKKFEDKMKREIIDFDISLECDFEEDDGSLDEKERVEYLYNEFEDFQRGSKGSALFVDDEDIIELDVFGRKSFKLLKSLF